jgi:peptide/nickel transport system permease protein
VTTPAGMPDVVVQGGTVQSPSAAPAIQGRSPWQLAWRRLRRDRWAMASLATICALVLVAVLAPLVVKVVGHPPNAQYRDTGLTLDGSPVGPGSTFWLGTDNLGRDVLSRIIYGTRVSLLVGVVATGISVVIGVAIGLVAGFYGGFVDTVLSRFVDTMLSFPFLLTAIALVSIVGPSLSVSIFVIVLFSWTGIARIVRGQVLSIREKEYIEAARSLGAGPLRTMLIDVLPNLTGPLIVYATLLVPTAIVFEATLSFLGLSVVPPTATWGNMLSDAQQYYTQAWWFIAFPSLALLVTTLAFNLLGDGLRDALDPRSGL